MNTNYKPFISPARESARVIRNEAIYDANLQAGINSDSFQDMYGLTDAEYCYFLKVGQFMPSYSSGLNEGSIDVDR